MWITMWKKNEHVGSRQKFGHLGHKKINIKSRHWGPAVKSSQASNVSKLHHRDYADVGGLWYASAIMFSIGTGSGRGGPDPTFPRLFRENPVSRTFFIGFPNTAFLSKKYILKSLIITTKAHKWKRLVDSFDWYFEFTQFLKASAKRKSFLFLSVKRAGITNCHI